MRPGTRPRAALYEAGEAERRRLQKLMDQARFLADATDLLTQSLDAHTTLRRLAHLTVPALADWCTVYMREGDEIRLVAMSHTDPSRIALAEEFNERYPIDIESSAGAAGVIRSGVSQLTPVITREMLEEAAPDDEFVRIVADELRLHSVLTVPMRARGETFGALVLIWAETHREFTEDDVAFAEDFATHAALAVDNARLFTEVSTIADTLQRSLLPVKLPEIEGFQVAARYRPAAASRVGGDFYDLWKIGEDTYGVAIGDVVGKGAAAAALTALCRHTTRTASLALPDHAPGAVLEQLNNGILNRSSPGSFCTAVYALLERTPVGAEVVIAAGGHPRPFLLRADGSVDHPGESGTLLGAFPEIETHEYPVALEPGDTLVFWTDGITERRNGGELYGEERLAELLRSLAGEGVEQLAERILDDVLAFSEADVQDDIALVILQA